MLDGDLIIIIIIIKAFSQISPCGKNKHALIRLCATCAMPNPSWALRNVSGRNQDNNNGKARIYAIGARGSSHVHQTHRDNNGNRETCFALVRQMCQSHSRAAVSLAYRVAQKSGSALIPCQSYKMTGKFCNVKRDYQVFRLIEKPLALDLCCCVLPRARAHDI